MQQQTAIVAYILLPRHILKFHLLCFCGCLVFCLLQVLLQLNIAFYLPSIPVLLLFGQVEKLLDAEFGQTASMAMRLMAGKPSHSVRQGGWCCLAGLEAAGC